LNSQKSTILILNQVNQIKLYNCLSPLQGGLINIILTSPISDIEPQLVLESIGVVSIDLDSKTSLEISITISIISSTNIIFKVRDTLEYPSRQVHFSSNSCLNSSDDIGCIWTV
jgi:hypothetical protein